MWLQIAMAAANVITGKQRAKAQQTLNRAQFEMEKGEAVNRSLATASQNMMRMAEANQARYNQQRQNGRIMENYDTQRRANDYNGAQTIDALNRGTFESRLTAASNFGAIAAGAAAAGVGGGSVEQVKQTTRLQNERQDDANTRRIGEAEYAQNLNKVALMDNAYNSLDNQTIFGSFEYKAQDLVLDNSYADKYTWQQAAGDAFKGFNGNMSNIGINAQSKGATRL